MKLGTDACIQGPSWCETEPRVVAEKEEWVKDQGSGAEGPFFCYHHILISENITFKPAFPIILNRCLSDQEEKAYLTFF